MKIAQSKTREQFPLSEKKIIKKTISRTIGFAMLLFFVWMFAVSFINATSNKFELGLSLNLYIGVVVFIFILVYFYERWYFMVYFYDLTPDLIQIKKGPITPREITIPYERVQDIYVDQDLLDRMFGLYDVHLSSATISSGMAAHIDGVEKIAADGLRALLLQTIQQKIGKNKTINTTNNSPLIK